MKKQINPTIKAQILRSAFILLSLVAVCAIPFSLAQRKAAKPAAKPNVASNVDRPRATATGPRRAPQAGPPASGVVSAATAPNLPRISEAPQTTSGVGAAHILPIPRAPKA